MDNPRPEKVAVVDEVRQHFEQSSAAILTEYRGLKVKDLAGLRRALRSNGGEYKIYKNTLVRLAAKESGLEALEEMLVGPTGITFVDGDAAAVAKVLRDYSRTNPLLLIKGGVLGEKIIGAHETAALAELPSREVLLAQLAGAIAAPMQQFAALLKALPQNLAYGLAALRDKKAEEGEPAGAPAGEPPGPTEAAAESAPEAAAEADASAPAEAATEDAAPAAADAASEDAAPAPGRRPEDATTAGPEAAEDAPGDSAGTDSNPTAE
jgi:large subunit ribosomal protein L10